MQAITAVSSAETVVSLLAVVLYLLLYRERIERTIQHLALSLISVIAIVVS